jgi:threonine dehydratase
MEQHLDRTNSEAEGEPAAGDRGALATPTLNDVLRAARALRAWLRPTALYRYPALDRLTGANIWIKHENHNPTGAFKVRGGINLVSQLSADERRRGLIAASTGNHGQSVAYAAAIFGVNAIVCVPERPNPAKARAMRLLGAEVIEHGRDFDEAREHAEELARRHGYRYVHSGDEPLLIAGVATAALEIVTERPEIETVIVPVGGGSGAAGACIAGKGLNPKLRVIGVQSRLAPAAFDAWNSGRKPADDEPGARARSGPAPMNTFAEGLATRTAFELPQRILRQHLDEFVLVSDDEIRAAMLLLIEHTRNLIEAAGAAAFAAALALKAELAGREVAVVCSGGNVSMQQLQELLAPSVETT